MFKLDEIEVYEIVEDCAQDLRSICWFLDRRSAEQWAKRLNKKLAPRHFLVMREDRANVFSRQGKHYPKEKFE